MTNIAIVGQMYAGKTTLANAVTRVGGHQRVLMAGPLKAIAGLAFGEDIDKGKEYPTSYGPKSGRQILQEVGQSMKAVDRDFWLNCFFNDIEHLTTIGKATGFVVDDVRFVFEAEALKANGWEIVKVKTPENIRLARGKAALGRNITAKELGHESEIEVNRITSDWLWGGTTPLKEYDARVANLLKHIEDHE